MIKIDKHKDIDGYANKLTDVINNKIELGSNRPCHEWDKEWNKYDWWKDT